LGITAFMWVFFLAYFHTLRHPVRPVTEMPLTALDHWVGFEPLALLPYVSLWIYVGFAPGLMPSLRQAVVYGLWAAALCLAGLLAFYAFPTSVPLHPMRVDVSQHAGFALLQGVDAAGNACPSLHVATAVFTACWVHRHLLQMGAPAWPKVLNVLWVLLIVWSTLATKQHVAWDVAAGTLLALMFVWPSMRWSPGDPPGGVNSGKVAR
ncbi:MAG: phosphatase PAP2 family protein, partial [Rubrivivax sp.]|nr:phosphatase PAP2 family protein [Rubrivivax sp.]